MNAGSSLHFHRLGKSGLWRIVLFILPVAFGYCTAESGAEAIVYEKAVYDSVRESLYSQYTNDTTDPGVCLAYAQSITDVVAAQSLYKKVAVWKAAPDSLRAEAYYRLACIAYMAGNYVKARTYCASACKLNEKPEYAQLQSRPVLRSVGDSVTKKSVASVAATGSAIVHSDTGKKSIESIEKNGPTTGKGTFYLQVGAFAAIDNAQGLKNELSRRFSRVAVAAATSNGKNVYRVRVGAFTGKEAARAFGDSALAKKGIPFTVVEE